MDRARIVPYRDERILARDRLRQSARIIGPRPGFPGLTRIVIDLAPWPYTALVIGALLSFVGTLAVRAWATRRGFVDVPGGRKAHLRPVALGGGIAILIAVLVPMLAAVAAARMIGEIRPSWIPPEIYQHIGGLLAKTPIALAIAAAATAICILGLIDDARPLPAGLKFLVQLAIALALVVGCNLRLLSHLHPALSTALSVLWILTLTNSLNFLDNMDGLAAGVGMIAAGVFATTALAAGQVFVPACCWLLAGALAGFLPFNFSPARIYLGDAGSLLVGLLLAVFTILTTFASPTQGQHPVGVIAPLVVMAVPLYDTASVIFLRARSGARIWSGDRRHFSHRLVSRGMSERQAVMVIWLATLVTALPALLLPTASWALALGIGIQTLLVVALVSLLESTGRS
jgi:UDP-GlcNAc:undecaprenyl-phosphate/decaprenyl-phosphate GlcNAc-1-phosphate transferase